MKYFEGGTVRGMVPETVPLGEFVMQYANRQLLSPSMIPARLIRS